MRRSLLIAYDPLALARREPAAVLALAWNALLVTIAGVLVCFLVPGLALCGLVPRSAIAGSVALGLLTVAAACSIAARRRERAAPRDSTVEALLVAALLLGASGLLMAQLVLAGGRRVDIAAGLPIAIGAAILAVVLLQRRLARLASRAASEPNAG